MRWYGGEYDRGAEEHYRCEYGFNECGDVYPVIVKKSGAFETEEGCLSLIGVRKINRYEEIEVEYEDMNFMKQHQKFSGWIAQIIQHECDHLEGIII